MGHSMAKLWWGGDPDSPDPVSGLSKRDIFNIRRTWTPMFEHAERVGFDIIKRMLHSESVSRTVLKSFRHMEDEALRQCQVFKSHVITYMSIINNVVNSLHEPNVAISMLHTFGGLQTKERVPAKFFDILDKEFIDYLVEDRKLSNSSVESWKHFIAFANPHILKHS